MSIEAMKQAREVIELGDDASLAQRYAVLTNIDQAIAEAEKQEPVAWRAPNWGHSADEWVYRDADDPVLGLDGKPTPNNEPLYTTPQPQREWVGLTFEEILETYRGPDGSDYVDYARAIEAKLKEKSHG